MPRIDEAFLNLRASDLSAEWTRAYPVYADANVMTGRSGPAEASDWPVSTGEGGTP